MKYFVYSGISAPMDNFNFVTSFTKQGMYIKMLVGGRETSELLVKYETINFEKIVKEIQDSPQEYKYTGIRNEITAKIVEYIYCKIEHENKIVITIEQDELHAIATAVLHKYLTVLKA